MFFYENENFYFYIYAISNSLNLTIDFLYKAEMIK